MPDVLKDLLVVSWRDIVFPITTREFGFQQETAQHRYIFRDEKLIESLGRDNPTFRYTIPFREGIIRKQDVFGKLFSETYPLFLMACRDRSSGTLQDPVLGGVPAKCVSYREVLDVNRRDGIDVEAEWILAPDPSESSAVFGIGASQQDVQKQAADFDSQIAPDGAAEKLLKDLNVPSKQGELDPFAAVQSIADQIDNTGNKVQANVDKLNGQLDRTILSIDKLREPRLTPLRHSARKMQDTASRLPETVGATGNRPILEHLVEFPTNVPSVAGKLGMSVPDMIKLNGSLARSPQVKQGTVVRYYGRESLSGDLTEILAHPLQ